MLGVKGEKNTKTNKIIIAKNRKSYNTNFPFDNIKRLSLLWNICLNMIL
jgi:hypothetical protein